MPQAWEVMAGACVSALARLVVYRRAVKAPRGLLLVTLHLGQVCTLLEVMAAEEVAVSCQNQVGYWLVIGWLLVFP